MIATDPLQWILGRNREEYDGQVYWRDKTYHPNLSNLLDELSEQEFRNNTKKLKQLEDLDSSIEKVYRLIERIGRKLVKEDTHSPSEG